MISEQALQLRLIRAIAASRPEPKPADWGTVKVTRRFQWGELKVEARNRYLCLKSEPEARSVHRGLLDARDASGNRIPRLRVGRNGDSFRWCPYTGDWLPDGENWLVYSAHHQYTSGVWLARVLGAVEKV